MGQDNHAEPDKKTISVLVADSTPLTGHLLAEALRRDRGLTANNISARGNFILTDALELQPDITILSENLEGIPGRGLAVLRQLRATVPKTRTIMLLDHDERNTVVETFRSGARGVFSRNDPVRMLAKCVHRVHEGQLWVSTVQLLFVLEALSEAPATQLVDAKGSNLLSKREQDVVRWLAEGLTNVEIARELGLSENTVRNYIFRIFNKLGVSSRVEVVIYASNQRYGPTMTSHPLPPRGVMRPSSTGTI
jgi:DNA-binding NarL/FixJ family response regulator